ncbi:hypothetical protein [Pseudonocardia xishanensis]|uniref:Uncharacterized protein n=1 Tax=Pseudonocardia xishanensis TaxID=630995 RepID=A0ABP8S2F1_9PSEU
MGEGICVAAAVLTGTFPDPPRTGELPDAEDPEPADPAGHLRPAAAHAEPTAVARAEAVTVPADLGYLATLRAGLAEAVGSPVVRGALLPPGWSA